MSELRARVISQEKGLYQISSGTEVKQASVSGKFRYEAQTVSDYPAVGDYVLAEWQEAGSPAIIRSLFPRKSCFLRKAAGSAKQEQVVAANIDTVFLCMSRNQNFNLRRLERYLSIAYDSGAEPVVVLTKADLCQDPEDKLAQVRTAAPGAEILTVSSLTGDTDAVLPYILPGRTVAFLGSSGVGKSTLINKLMGTSALATGAVGTADKGRHTTTHRQLLTLPNGAFLIDTPGMRELGMWDSDGGIDTAFQDLLELTARLPVFQLHAHCRARLRGSESAGRRHAGRRTLGIVPEAEAGKCFCGGAQPLSGRQTRKIQEHLKNQQDKSKKRQLTEKLPTHTAIPRQAHRGIAFFYRNAGCPASHAPNYSLIRRQKSQQALPLPSVPVRCRRSFG